MLDKLLRLGIEPKLVAARSKYEFECSYEELQRTILAPIEVALASCNEVTLNGAMNELKDRNWYMQYVQTFLGGKMDVLFANTVRMHRDLEAREFQDMYGKLILGAGIFDKFTQIQLQSVAKLAQSQCAITH